MGLELGTMNLGLSVTMLKEGTFTINALYYDPKLNELLDFTKSCADIDQKCIRMIGKPEERFKEDPVRMLRAARMAAKLNSTLMPTS